MKRKNQNLVKINVAADKELKKELKLIEDKRLKLYNKYINEKPLVFNALKDNDFDRECLLTIINDLETTFINDLSFDNKKLIDDINKNQMFDKVDLLLINNINQQQANNIRDLKLLVFSDWNKESNRTLIAKLIINHIALIEAIQNIGYISKDSKYSWAKYTGGLYNYKYLKQRVITLIKNPNFKYTRFNEFKDNKKTKPSQLYSDKELLKQETLRKEYDDNSNL